MMTVVTHTFTYITTQFLLQNTTHIYIGYSGAIGKKKGKNKDVIAKITDPIQVQEIIEVIGFDEKDFQETIFYNHPMMNLQFLKGSEVILRLYYLDNGYLQKSDWDYSKFIQPKQFSKFLSLLKALMPTDLMEVDMAFLNYWENMGSRIQSIQAIEQTSRATHLTQNL